MSRRNNNKQNAPKAISPGKAVPLPQVGDVSLVELKKKADAKKSVKQKPKQQPAEVKKGPITDRVNLFDRPLPSSFPAYLCDTNSDVERGEADPLPPPSELFAAYCRSKVLEQAKQRRPVSPQGFTTKEYHHFVPLTNEPAFGNDCDGAVGPTIGTFSLVKKHSLSMWLLPVHQRGRQVGVMTTTKTLAELGLEDTAGTRAVQVTSIVDLLARNQSNDLQMNLVMFSGANILDSVVSRFPFPISTPESGFTISSVSHQSSYQPMQRPELFYSEQIEVFGFPSEF